MSGMTLSPDERKAMEAGRPKDHVGHYELGWERCREFLSRVPPEQRITHGRHCVCSACAAQDWADPKLAPCGMHGPSCPPRYAPLGAAGDNVPSVPSEQQEDDARHITWDYGRRTLCGKRVGGDPGDFYLPLGKAPRTDVGGAWCWTCLTLQDEVSAARPSAQQDLEVGQHIIETVVDCPRVEVEDHMMTVQHLMDERLPQLHAAVRAQFGPSVQQTLLTTWKCEHCGYITHHSRPSVQQPSEGIKRRDFNAEHPDRPGVTVGEDLADQNMTLAFRLQAAEAQEPSEPTDEEVEAAGRIIAGVLTEPGSVEGRRDLARRWARAALCAARKAGR